MWLKEKKPYAAGVLLHPWEGNLPPHENFFIFICPYALWLVQSAECLPLNLPLREKNKITIYV